MKKEQKAEITTVKVLDVRPYKAPKGPLRGFATVQIGVVVVKGIQIMDFHDDGDYTIAFPSEKGKDKDGKDAYYRTVWLDAGSKEATAALYREIEKAVVNNMPG